MYKLLNRILLWRCVHFSLITTAAFRGEDKCLQLRNKLVLLTEQILGENSNHPIKVYVSATLHKQLCRKVTTGRLWVAPGADV